MGRAIREQLLTVLLRHGQAKLADLWDVSSGEVSKRLAGERNIPLNDFAAALEAAGVQLVDKSDVVVSRRKYEALCTLAAEHLNGNGE